MRALLLAVFLLPAVASADDAVGAWQGSIDVPGHKLEIRVTFPDKTSGTIDIPAQGANGAPLKDVKLEGDTVTFTLAVPGAPAIFAGKRSGDTMTGTLTQGGQSIPFSLKRAGAAPVAEPPLPMFPAKDAGPLLGTWSGSDLELTLRAEGDSVAGTLSVSRQCLREAKVTRVGRTSDGGARIEVHGKNDVAITLDGHVAGFTFTGAVRQLGQSAPMALRRVDPAELPYTSEEVTYKNGDVTLAGTLTRPRAAKKPPAAVVLITGSGAQDRDECVFGVRPFAAISDALSRAGIAVLRSDDRGVGGSSGDFAHSTGLDFANDTTAAVAYLRGRPDIDKGRIGLLGHSEGGYIAPMLAAKDKDLAFIVLLAGPGTPLAEVMVDQLILIDKAEGVEQKDIDAEAKLIRDTLALFRSTKPRDPRTKARLAAIAKRDVPEALLQKMGGADAIAEGYTAKFDTEWLRFYLTYDPVATLRKVSCPVLAVNGAKDTQVPPDKNLEAIKAALEKGGNPRFTIAKLAGDNHLFQHAATGSPSEYAKLEPKIDPELLTKVTAFIVEHTGSP